MATKKPADESVSILEVKRQTLDVCIVGVTPQIHQSMSNKVKYDFLLPAQKKNAAERASSLKHSPRDEFRDAAYRAAPGAETLLAMPSTAWKAAIRSAALDMPGASKTQIGRLLFVNGEMIPVWGIPKMLMSVVRMADMARTPDIRTRPILAKWATRLSVTFVTPLLKEQAVVNLLAAAGLTIGLSDWRPQKGSGNYGQFRICDPDDAEFKAIIKSGGRKAQEAAMKEPEAYDDESMKMLSWYDVEVRRRGFKVAA